jgi:hypothetical protein
MSRADDIIKRSQERASSSPETQKKAEEVLKKIEDQRDYVKAKLALSSSYSSLDKQAKKELKALAKETKKSQTSWVEKHSARDTLAMLKASRDKENPPESVCFVATVVYGDINAHQVEALRRFRDKTLMSSNVGRLLVRLYYGGMGKAIAMLLRSGPSPVIKVVRKVLDKIVTVETSTRKA